MNDNDGCLATLGAVCILIVACFVVVASIWVWAVGMRNRDDFNALSARVAAIENAGAKPDASDER